MCNPARLLGEPETLFGSAGRLFTARPRGNPFALQELCPGSCNYVIREELAKRAWDGMSREVPGRPAAWPMTNVRRPEKPQRRRLAGEPLPRPAHPVLSVHP
ncbi:hypothetical protein EDF57_109124 [Novosphingobium sp. PhB55]|uniref:hypothetical protein n=1 Tax=Novosphingobium sp. PhB55 TaxID=2485106 RepID=UPI0010EA42FD|nr:hypothetical protein EDF57_109124 [Novosphingobium sp. PhB55]